MCMFTIVTFYLTLHFFHVHPTSCPFSLYYTTCFITCHLPSRTFSVISYFPINSQLHIHVPQAITELVKTYPTPLDLIARAAVVTSLLQSYGNGAVKTLGHYSFSIFLSLALSTSKSSLLPWPAGAMGSGASYSTCPNPYTMRRVVLQSVSKFSNPSLLLTGKRGRPNPLAEVTPRAQPVPAVHLTVL